MLNMLYLLIYIYIYIEREIYIYICIYIYTPILLTLGDGMLQVFTGC